jgi:polysaccharide biosynthesis/export protein
MKRVLLFLLLCLAALSPGQLESTYRLQPEDIIQMRVYREDSLAAEMPIGRDGNISAPFIGVIRAAGKTVSELEAELAQQYERVLRLRNPRVSVNIIRFRSVRASVVGAVRQPDTFDVRPTDTVLTLIARAKGTMVEADLRHAYLRRANTNEQIPIDLYSLLMLADTSQNYTIEDGDELNVPEQPKPRVTVAGAVLSPGVYGYKEPMTLMDAIGLARGEIRYRSWTSRTVVIREMPGRPQEYLRIQCNLVAFYNGDASQNIALRPGDIVFVPDTKTPDVDRIAAVASTLFFLDRFFRENTLGLNFFK